MASNFGERVQHVLPGSPVAASNTSRPTRQLEDRTNYLQDQLLAIESSQLLIQRAQTVAPGVLEGQPVFWNPILQRYELAFAGVATDQASGTLVPLPSCDCAGLVLSKIDATTADIALVGIASFASLAHAIDGPVVPGRYYLSSTQPGKLVQQRPPATVVVCLVLGPLNDCDDTVSVHIMPQMRDFLEDHIHYRFDLTALPAGQTYPPIMYGIHEITDPDPTLRGWLPADHASFEGLAPSGARFGYNLAAHPELQMVWPPIPVESVVLFWDKGQGDLVGGTETPSRGPDPVVIFDRYGIWWLSDCYADVPWPKDLDTTESMQMSMSMGCPRTDVMRLVLAFTHQVFATDKTVVTSLAPDVGQPLAFVNCHGDVARTGDLFARIDVSLAVDTAEQYGGQAFKTLETGLKFGQGWLTEGIISDTPDVLTITSSHSRHLTPTDNMTPVVHQGIVHLSVSTEPGEKEILPQIVKLGDALEREYLGVVYLGLPDGRTSGLRMPFAVPFAGLPANPVLKLRLWLFGRGLVGPFCALNASYQRIAAPVHGPTPIAAGDTAFSLDVVTPSSMVAADNIMQVESAPVAIAPGDVFIIELLRSVSAVPAFAAELGIVRISCVITSGT